MSRKVLTELLRKCHKKKVCILRAGPFIIKECCLESEVQYMRSFTVHVSFLTQNS